MTMYEFAKSVMLENKLDDSLASKGRVSYPMIKDVDTNFSENLSKNIYWIQRT